MTSRSFDEVDSALYYLRSATAWPIRDHSTFVVTVESRSRAQREQVDNVMDLWRPNKFWTSQRHSTSSMTVITVIPNLTEASLGYCRVAMALKHYPFKGVARFYDVGGILADPVALQQAIQGLVVLVQARFHTATKLGAIDARGFLFAPGMALKLKLPVAMIRKKGTLPNAGTNTIECQGLEAQRHAVGPGDRIVLVDDLVATGATFKTAIACLEFMGARVVGCVSLVELDAFKEAQATIPVPHVALFESERALMEAGSSRGGSDG